MEQEVQTLRIGFDAIEPGFESALCPAINHYLHSMLLLHSFDIQNTDVQIVFANIKYGLHKYYLHLLL